jgi:hypothetical protein
MQDAVLGSSASKSSNTPNKCVQSCCAHTVETCLQHPNERGFRPNLTHKFGGLIVLSLALVAVMAMSLAILLGCVRPPEVARLDNVQRDSTSEIQIFTSRDVVRREYKEIGILSVRVRHLEDGLNKLKAEARRLGANAIILESTESIPSYVMVGNVLVPSKRKVMQAVAIVFVP